MLGSDGGRSTLTTVSTGGSSPAVSSSTLSSSGGGSRMSIFHCHDILICMKYAKTYRVAVNKAERLLLFTAALALNLGIGLDF